MSGRATSVEAPWEDSVTAAPPTGTVTFLLTDVESSTSHWRDDPDAMSAAMARHGEILDSVAATHGGARPLEQGEGDSAVLVFPSAAGAVRAAVDAQRGFVAEPWPTRSPLRVRMALHTGEARLRDDRNYGGDAIIRAARLRNLAHGGQVVVSSTTRDLVGGELPPEVEMVDLGRHRLEDLERPEHVWQVTVEGLPAEFPALRSPGLVPNNLPAAASSFVGRFDAIDTVARLVLTNRLVTITGSGGAGKTRLVQRVAAEIADGFPDGVWWVELAPVDDPGLVASAISRAASLPEDRTDRVAGLARRLRPHRALVVLDNCEHLLDATAEVVATLLAQAPQVAVLATSRASLNVPGEISWRVPPLSGDDAARLFVERASAVRGDLEADPSAPRAIAEICERLDGVPLAIELAAARCRVLSPAEILDHLGDALTLLVGSQRGVLPRHRTIDACIRWSHSLLDPREQSVLRRLAVFAGAFTLDAARAVVSDGDRARDGTLGALETLADHSFLRVETGGRETRYRLAETVRQFARRELEASGEQTAVRARHAEWFRGRALGLWPLFEPHMTELLDRSDAEFEDLREMLDHLEQHATPEEHVAVAMACLPAMSVRHVAESSLLGHRAAARVDPMTRLGGALHLRLALVDTADFTHIELGSAAAAATGDPELVACARYWRAWAEATRTASPADLAALDAARSALAETGENHFANAYWPCADIRRAIGHHEVAEREGALGEVHTVCRRCSVMVWLDRALLTLARGELAAARDALARSLALAREVRDAGFLAQVLLARTELATHAGEPWPRDEIDAAIADGEATGNPLVAGFAREALAVGRLADGDVDIETDLASVIELLDEIWTKRTEARLRQIAARHARGERTRAGDGLASLRADAARWDAGPWLLAQIEHRAAALALDDGDPGQADDLAHRALADAWLGPWPPLVIVALELLAAVALARESHVEAARLLGAAAAQRHRIEYRLDVEPERSRTTRTREALVDALGDSFETACAEGARLTLDEVVAYARRARGERRRPSHGWDGLTPTERQVAQLAISGLSNAEIAQRLFVGRETVKTHLSNVYLKVGVANRTQLVADAARRGITP